MKKSNVVIAITLCISIVLSGCSSMSNTTKGGLFGGGAGAAVGAGIGALIGKSTKSAAIGAGIGTVVGATTGVIIGKKMDKAAAQAAAIEGARVDSIRDANNLKAIKVTFDSGILFQTGKSTLNTASKDALTKFAKILVSNPTMDITIMGHTDNQGSLEVNQKLSQDRAQAVANFLQLQNVSAAQFKDILGKNFAEPVADNKTAAGRAANRRVEVYMYASTKMINDAQAQAK
ncbi:MAG TPA: OmpA family protein [Paludibacter sp.]|nr:OmpA family protein [Paludibacter sp.]